jgi:abhydrolase domain-containing protein 6
MMESIFFVGLGIVAATWALILLIPVKCGRFAYGLSVKIETRLCGLKRSKIDIGEMEISLYHNKITDRPTIFMLHGFSADKDGWVRFARYFKNDFNIVIPDMAGHGDTGYDQSCDFTMPAQASRIAKLAEQMGISKMHLIGNSMGGFVVAHFALMHPELTLSIGLIDPAGVKAPESSDMEKMLAVGNNPFLIHNRQEFNSFFAMTMNQPPFIPKFVLKAMSDRYQQRRKQLRQIFSHRREQDLLDESLKDITVPTLLLWGEEDRLIHISSVSVWKAGIEGIQIKTWPGIGHMPMLEIPKESASVYRQFLNQKTTRLLNK